MPDLLRRSRSCLLPLTLAALAAACGGGGPGRDLRSVELVDFSVPGMFKQVAAQLRRASVLELPPWPVNERHELRMEDTTERELLDALCDLDPRFQHAMDGPALLMWPTGQDEQSSPFSRRLETFQAEGGAYAVLQQLLAAALPRDTVLVFDKAGQARPVRLDLADVSVRDVLVQVAGQAHLAVVVEPGYVRVGIAPE